MIWIEKCLECNIEPCVISGRLWTMGVLMILIFSVMVFNYIHLKYRKQYAQQPP